MTVCSHDSCWNMVHNPTSRKLNEPTGAFQEHNVQSGSDFSIQKQWQNKRHLADVTHSNKRLLWQANKNVIFETLVFGNCDEYKCWLYTSTVICISTRKLENIFTRWTPPFKKKKAKRNTTTYSSFSAVNKQPVSIHNHIITLDSP